MRFLRLSNARELGDLSENSEYSGAKESLVPLWTVVLQNLKRYCTALKLSPRTQKHMWTWGSKVTLHLKGKEIQFHIVGEWEADPTAKKISHSSPLGKALMGKKVGKK